MSAATHPFEGADAIAQSGVSRKSAEAIVQYIDSRQDELATKGDVADLKGSVEAMKREIILELKAHQWHVGGLCAGALGVLMLIIRFSGGA